MIPLRKEPFQTESRAKSQSPERDLAWHSAAAVKHQHGKRKGRSQVVADELQEAVGPDGEAPGCIIWKDPTGLMQTLFEEG